MVVLEQLSVWPMSEANKSFRLLHSAQTSGHPRKDILVQTFIRLLMFLIAIKYLLLDVKYLDVSAPLAIVFQIMTWRLYVFVKCQWSSNHRRVLQSDSDGFAGFKMLHVFAHGLTFQMWIHWLGFTNNAQHGLLPTVVFTIDANAFLISKFRDMAGLVHCSFLLIVRYKNSDIYRNWHNLDDDLN